MGFDDTYGGEYDIYKGAGYEEPFAMIAKHQAGAEMNAG